jgi:hypothetical protein
MPFMSSNIAAGAGIAVFGVASSASRSPSTVLICYDDAAAFHEIVTH